MKAVNIINDANKRLFFFKFEDEEKVAGPVLHKVELQHLTARPEEVDPEFDAHVTPVFKQEKSL